MSIDLKNELYEKYVNQIKAVGQHLIDNAENILNDFETEHRKIFE